MTPPISVAAPKGPTLATLKAIEEVLRQEAMPMTRYKIRQALGNRVAQPLLHEALEYLADHEMVYDEGPGGKVLWIRASGAAHGRLRGVPKPPGRGTSAGAPRRLRGVPKPPGRGTSAGALRRLRGA